MENSASAKQLPNNINRVLYCLMLVTGIYFLVIGNLSAATSLIPVAMIFDPFDQLITWTKRPIWQKTWLITHLILSLILIGFNIFYA